MIHETHKKALLTHFLALLISVLPIQRSLAGSGSEHTFDHFLNHFPRLEDTSLRPNRCKAFFSNMNSILNFEMASIQQPQNQGSNQNFERTTQLRELIFDDIFFRTIEHLILDEYISFETFLSEVKKTALKTQDEILNQRKSSHSPCYVLLSNPEETTLLDAKIENASHKIKSDWYFNGILIKMGLPYMQECERVPLDGLFSSRFTDFIALEYKHSLIYQKDFKPIFLLQDEASFSGSQFKVAFERLEYDLAELNQHQGIPLQSSLVFFSVPFLSDRASSFILENRKGFLSLDNIKFFSSRRVLSNIESQEKTITKIANLIIQKNIPETTPEEQEQVSNRMGHHLIDNLNRLPHFNQTHYLEWLTKYWGAASTLVFSHKLPDHVSSTIIPIYHMGRDKIESALSKVSFLSPLGKLRVLRQWDECIQLNYVPPYKLPF